MIYEKFFIKELIIITSSKRYYFRDCVLVKDFNSFTQLYDFTIYTYNSDKIFEVERLSFSKQEMIEVILDGNIIIKQ